MNSVVQWPIAPSRQPAIATEPTTRIPAERPNANISRSNTPKSPKDNPRNPTTVKQIPSAVMNLQILISMVILIYLKYNVVDE